MSLTSKQIDELRAYAKDRKGELAKLITDAADTIEMLSAKLHASQMERSSQYYHGGWIPCSERLPELRVYVIATTQWYEITMACRIGDGEWFIEEGNANAYDDDVIAWMPLPEPYREGES